MGKAIYAGSFNPFHLGHITIAYQASRIFNHLYIVVAQNENKPNAHTSVESIEKDLKSWTVSDTSVVLLPPNKLLVDFAQENGVEFLVRGVRGAKDFVPEMEMADINLDLSYERIGTVFLASPIYRHLSSSLIRSLVGKDGWERHIKRYVPCYSAEEFIENSKKDGY